MSTVGTEIRTSPTRAADWTLMRFPAFERERMQSVWEHKVKYDLS